MLATVRPEQIEAPRFDTLDVFNQAREFANMVAPTEFVPGSLRNRPGAVASAVLYGREIGLPPMIALASLDVIDGTPALRGKAALAKIFAAGHRVWEDERTEGRGNECQLHGQRRGDDHVYTTTWTLEDARRANLVNKDNWRKYPRQMLYWRALGELARIAFPDVLAGIQVLVEELQAGWPGLPETTTTGGAATATDGGSDTEPPSPRTRTVRRPQPPAGPGPPEPLEPMQSETTPTETPQPGRPAGSSGAPASAEPQQAPPSGEEAPQEAGPQPEPSRPSAPPERPQGATRAEVATPNELAQLVAKVCRENNVDRPRMIALVTGGQTASARHLTHAEAAEVIEKARAFGRGEEVPGYSAEEQQPPPDQPRLL